MMTGCAFIYPIGPSSVECAKSLAEALRPGTVPGRFCARGRTFMGLRPVIQRFPSLRGERFLTGELGWRSHRDRGPLRRVPNPRANRVRKIAPAPWQVVRIARRFCTPYGAALVRHASPDA